MVKTDSPTSVHLQKLLSEIRNTSSKANEGTKNPIGIQEVPIVKNFTDNFFRTCMMRERQKMERQTYLPEIT